MGEGIIRKCQAVHSGLCFRDTMTLALFPWQQTCVFACVCMWHPGICFLLEKVNYISTAWLNVQCIIMHANETCTQAFVFVCPDALSKPSRMAAEDMSTTGFCFGSPLWQQRRNTLRAYVAVPSNRWQLEVYFGGIWRKTLSTRRGRHLLKHLHL